MSKNQRLYYFFSGLEINTGLKRGSCKPAQVNKKDIALVTAILSLSKFYAMLRD